MPSANNNIIYNTTTGDVISRIVGDASLITLNPGEALTQLDIVDDLDNIKINPDGSQFVVKLTFDEGVLVDNEYTLSNLPFGAQITFDSITYTVNDGSITFVIDFQGLYDVFCSHPDYKDATFYVAIEDDEPIDGGGGFEELP